MPGTEKEKDKGGDDNGKDGEDDNAGAIKIAEAEQIVVPRWFVAFFNTGVRSVVGFNSITLLVAGANLGLWGEGLGGARKWYVGGLGAAVAHYGFVPLVGPSVRALFVMCERREGKGMEKGSAVKSVREWVGWHNLRMGTVDIVAWMCFFVGVVEVLSA
jgi:hypothetical protein